MSMHRSGSVGDVLYSDALKREEKLKEKRREREESETHSIKQGVQPIKTSNLLIQDKVKKEFNYALTTCEILGATVNAKKFA